MLSKSSKYAIRAVLYLAMNSNETNKYSPKEIAKATNVPAAFLAKTLQELTRRNLISSLKGRNGGFYVTEENKSNSLISIVDSLDGMDKFQDCVLGLPICSNESPCPLHHSFSSVRNNIIQELTCKTIADLSKEISNGQTHII